MAAYGLLATPAFAQVGGIDLLQATPQANYVRLPPKPSDETIPQGAAVPLPDMTIRDDEPFAMEADEVGYDQKNAIVVAQGNVEVVQGANILSAQKLVYFQRLNLVKASGDVSVLQPSGDVYFADAVELKDDMKRGVIRNFRARLADNSVFAATEARKVSPVVTQLENAAYTPCNLCKGVEPFWQLKARDVEIDEQDETVRYANAHMEIMGVPMMYTPVLSHPTPDASAKSGFLTPTYSSDNNLGTLVQVPYYWRIGPDKDITLTPWYSTDVGPLLEGDYRQLTDGGNYSVQFSGTYPEELDDDGREIGGNEFRGHIYAQGQEELSTYSRVGFDIQRATDDTYLRRYRFGDQRYLFSRAYAEAAQNRNYATVQGLSIQGLRVTDDANTTPLILPSFEGYYETDPYDSGLTLHAFGNAQSLTRDEGVDQHRLSLTTGATLPYVSEGGHVFKSTVSLRNDLYRTQDILINNGTQSYTGNQTRFIPQASVEWRYPLIRNIGEDALTIEPIALAVAQPTGKNPQEISNEDNRLIELTDTNLFSLDRMPGLDTVDSGSRFAYGLRSQYLFAQGTAIDALLGQNYNVDDETPFPNSITPGENASDYIGRVAFNYQPVTFGYRFALDRENLASNRNEITFGYAEPWLRFDAVYRSLENNRYLRDSEEAILNAAMPIPYSDEWSVYGGLRRDLTLDQMVATNLGLVYQNECFSLYLQSLRTFTRDRDIEPATQFTLRVGFKNLGEFGDY